MFKITCFAPIEPEQLGKALKGIHFMATKKGYEWSMDGTTFRIEPFQEQPRDSMKGYRIYFDGDIHGGTYLFDLSIGCMGAEVTGVEYQLEHQSMKKEQWLKDLRRRPSFKMIDPRGLFMKQKVGVVLLNDSVILQLHSRKNQKLIMVNALKEIDFIRDELQPVEFDLFSYATKQEEIA